MPEHKDQEHSLLKRFMNSFDLRKSLLLLFAVIYVIKNYIKSSYLSDESKGVRDLWKDKQPVLPSREPLFYGSQVEHNVIATRGKIFLPIAIFLIFIIILLKRINSRPPKDFVHLKTIPNK